MNITQMHKYIKIIQIKKISKFIHLNNIIQKKHEHDTNTHITYKIFENHEIER